MNLRELLHNHDRGQIEQFSKDRARACFLGDSTLCRTLGMLNLYVDPKNYDMTPWLALDGYWESWITLAIGRAIQPGWTCIDAGAWCGYYTALMGNLVGEKGRVIAFEPDPDNAERAMKSSLANGYHWAEVRIEAISDKEGDGFIHVTDGAGGTSLAEHGTPVKTVTLDSIEGRVDLIKIDIEGGEEQAWEGMHQLLARNPNCIVIMEWDSRRYRDPAGFADAVCAFAAPREVTVEGGTIPVNRDQLLMPVMRNLWLQK